MEFIHAAVDWMISYADSPYALAALFVFAFWESSFFPLPPDPLLMYVRQVEAFNQAVATGTEPSASGWDGLKVAEVTIAMVESARTGRRISLS